MAHVAWDRAGWVTTPTELRRKGVEQFPPHLVPRGGKVLFSWLPIVGYWPLVIGDWLLAIDYWRLAIGYWLLVIGYWRLAIGDWLLVIRYWLFVIGYW